MLIVTYGTGKYKIMLTADEVFWLDSIAKVMQVEPIKVMQIAIRMVLRYLAKLVD